MRFIDPDGMQAIDEEEKTEKKKSFWSLIASLFRASSPEAKNPEYYGANAEQAATSALTTGVVEAVDETVEGVGEKIEQAVAVITPNENDGTVETVLKAGVQIALPLRKARALGKAGKIAIDIFTGSKTFESLGVFDAFAHEKKKQSTGKSGGDKHDKQYRHGGKNRPENPNKRKRADDRRNKGK